MTYDKTTQLKNIFYRHKKVLVFWMSYSPNFMLVVSFLVVFTSRYYQFEINSVFQNMILKVLTDAINCEISNILKPCREFKSTLTGKFIKWTFILTVTAAYVLFTLLHVKCAKSSWFNSHKVQSVLQSI